MGIPLRQQIRVGAYILKQRLRRRARYPLVLMLEPLFRCNLACAGCGKIDYPAPILNRRLSLRECLDAVDECGAPIVSIPGGEPLIHKEIAEIVKAFVERRKFVYLCTNALLVEKKVDLFEPCPTSPSRSISTACASTTTARSARTGVFDRAIAAIRLLRARGFRVNVNATLFDGVAPAEVAAFFDYVTTSSTSRASRSRRAMPTSARPTRPTSSTAARPSSFSATSSAAAAASAGGSTTRHFISTSSPATRSTAARRGAIRPATSSAGSAPAICSAKATQLLQGADGEHRLGPLRHRQLREVRRLHGALRLRGDRGDRCGAPPAEGDAGRAAADRDRAADGARDPARAPAPRGVRVRAAGGAGGGPPRSERRAPAPAGGATRRSAASARLLW